MATDLVTLAEVKRRLRLPAVGGEDADLRALLSEATAVVLRYVSQRRSDEGSPSWEDTINAWEPDTVPLDIKAAIFRQTAELYRFRGDDEVGPPRQPGRLSESVESLLVSYRDPAVS